MALQLLKLHWKGSRWIVLPLILLTSAVPLLTFRFVADLPAGMGPGPYLDTASGLGMFYPILAALAGSLVAVTAWNWDHQAGHVYALSLPISRARYSGLKFLAGFAILALPSAFLLGSGILASALLDLPDGLRAHPVSLTLHFLSASAVAYGLFFALAAGRMKTAVLVLGSIGVLVFLALFGGGSLDQAVGSLPGLNGFAFSDLVFQGLAGDWGPFRVFNGNWALIDV